MIKTSLLLQLFILLNTSAVMLINSVPVLSFLSHLPPEHPLREGTWQHFDVYRNWSKLLGVTRRYKANKKNTVHLNGCTNIGNLFPRVQVQDWDTLNIHLM